MSKHSKIARDNRANQLNPTHPAFHQSRAVSADQAQAMAELARDNCTNELKPNNTANISSPAKLKASSALVPGKPEQPEQRFPSRPRRSGRKPVHGGRP